MLLNNEIYVAMNFEQPQGATVPDWIMLIPAGEVVRGRDGRRWINDSPQTVIEMLVARNAHLPLDFEHATEIKAPKGDLAPAAAWFEAFEIRDGAVWGKASWTPAGVQAVANREYRYISPVLLYDEKNRIRSLSSVALVNKPNLLLPALNQETTHSHDGGTTMLKTLLAKLGLPETATLEQALNAIDQKETALQTALNRVETPSLDKFVPRADYDATLTRATNAEQKLAEEQKVKLTAAINSEIEAALAAGKIPPVSKDYYVAMCQQDGGLAQFQKFIESAPVIGKDSGLDGKNPAEKKALNTEEQQLAVAFGNSAEDIAKYGV